MSGDLAKNDPCADTWQIEEETWWEFEREDGTGLWSRHKDEVATFAREEGVPFYRFTRLRLTGPLVLEDS